MYLKLLTGTENVLHGSKESDQWCSDGSGQEEDDGGLAQGGGYRDRTMQMWTQSWLDLMMGSTWEEGQKRKEASALDFGFLVLGWLVRTFTEERKTKWGTG